MKKLWREAVLLFAIAAMLAGCSAPVQESTGMTESAQTEEIASGTFWESIPEEQKALAGNEEEHPENGAKTTSEEEESTSTAKIK